MPPLKRWNLKALPDENKVQELAISLNINKYLAAVLLQRGIVDFEKMQVSYSKALGSRVVSSILFLQANFCKGGGAVSRCLPETGCRFASFERQGSETCS